MILKEFLSSFLFLDNFLIYCTPLLTFPIDILHDEVLLCKWCNKPSEEQDPLQHYGWEDSFWSHFFGSVKDTPILEHDLAIFLLGVYKYKNSKPSYEI